MSAGFPSWIRGVSLTAALAAAVPLAAATYAVTNTADSGAGSLRQAITDANANVGTDAIHFDTPGSDPGCNGSGVCTIAPTSSLPVILDAVTIDGYTQPGAAVNTSATGTNAVLKIVLSGVQASGFAGLDLASSTTIRGLVIGGFLDGLSTILTTDLEVIGCFIGVDATGTTAFPNSRNGIYFDHSDGITIGGTALADRNLVSGNGNIGVAITLEGSTGPVVIQGNLVGTNAAGSAAIPNSADGVVATSNGLGGSFTIGGSAAGAGDVISGNGASGLNLGALGSGTTFTVWGNLIGTDAADALPVPNGSYGIRATANGAAIGGIGAGEGNVVADNSGGGVVDDAGATNVSIRGNSIHDNGLGPLGHGVGIDLSINIGGDGVTPNDLGDGDTGPNNLQNFPIVSSATPLVPSSGTHVQGVLHSTPSTTFDLDFYANDACIPHPHDFLQGRTYLGSGQVTTNASGTGSFSIDVPGTIQTGERTSATATDPNGNTSEFSQRPPFSIVPASGAAAGGAAVTISGTDFLAGATVTIGGVAATNVDVGSFNSLTADAPALAPGSLNDVTLTDSDGASGMLEAGYVADFLDVPPSEQFYTYVTLLVTNKITVGVGGGNYGVGQDTLRQQMAVFLMKAEHGLCYTPPPCATPGFSRTCPARRNFAPWIDELVRRRASREVAAAATLLSREPGAAPADGVVSPEDRAWVRLRAARRAHGIFADVPCPSLFADWIEELKAEYVTGGCGDGSVYCPASPNTRGQMATFLVKALGLP